MSNENLPAESTDLGAALRGPKLPSFIPEEDRELGTEAVGQYIRPPRIRVVQALSEELTAEFNVGDTVILPQRTILAPVKVDNKSKPLREKFDAGEAWLFTPVFFWAEWVKWNAREDEAGQAILDRTIDPNSELAAACRDRERWFEAHPSIPEAQIRNCEHLNFVVVPYSGEAAGDPCILSFSRAEHRCGTAFAGLIKMRKGPLFGSVYQASVGYRSNAQGNWYGIDIRNPENGSPWVDSQETYEHMKALHEEFKSNVDLVQVDYADETEPEEPIASTTEF